jgi:hypothetical protein
MAEELSEYIFDAVAKSTSIKAAVLENASRHKSLKQNASLEKSPTRTETTQQNYFFASLCAYVKLEGMKIKRGVNHFALKSKIYMSALRSAYAELVKLNPQPLTA